MIRTPSKMTAWIISLVFAASFPAAAQDTPPKQPLDHVIGAVTAVDASGQTITVKEDKTGTSQTIVLANTKTLLKVEPGAKDLKSAVRITAGDLEVGDRVDVRGMKTDAPDTLAARSVVLMSGRDLQQAHQAQAAAWQHATAGTVTAVDASSGTITITVVAADGPKPATIETSRATEFTRYAPDNPKTPAPSQLGQIRVSDKVRVIGDKSDDGATIKAQRVYSGAFRTLSATISSIGADGKSITVKDLATKKPVEVSLNDDSAIRKLPPFMANMLARRFNPNYKPPADAAAGGQGPGGGGANGGWAARGASGGGPGAPGSAGPGGGPGGGGMRSGDISQMLERVPKITLADLKQGDAVVISGVALGADNAHLLATGIIAGVEPILQSAPQRQGSVGGDWGLGEMSVPQ
jgi:hypothetical protein